MSKVDDIAHLFENLESNRPKEVEDVKSKFHELFNSTKDSWLVIGFVDYYMQTSSVRVIDILVGVREPHDKFLFDRLTECLKGNNRLQSLQLLGHIVKKQPAWLFKIVQHHLFKELIKILKTENDILPMMTALLALVVLLPMIPGYLSPQILNEIFDVFSRLASWNTQNPIKLSDEHLVHLKIGIFSLFLYLYGMFPYNFFIHLRQQYLKTDNLPVFRHTIKPMLESVRVHPLLVCIAADSEFMHDRWKNKRTHDVIVECAKFAVEITQSPILQQQQSGSSHDEIKADNKQRITPSVSSTPNPNALLKQTPNEYWSPSFELKSPPDIPLTPIQSCNISSKGITPPEAAIEATPENTPVKSDLPNIHIPINSNVKRAINLSLGSNSKVTSPSTSNPSSPVKKETFRFTGDDGRNLNAIQKLVYDRQKIAEETRNGQVLEEKEIVPEKHLAVEEKKPGVIAASEIEECHDCPLQMLNKKIFQDIANRVTRYRGHSVCLSSPTTYSAGTSPSDAIQIPLRVKRSSSCPDIKKSSWSSNLSNDAVLEETTQNENGAETNENQNGRLSLGTQTSIEHPYEHMLNAVLHVPPEYPSNTDFCPYNLLKQYISNSVKLYDYEHYENKKSKEHDLQLKVKSLQKQLELLHLHLEYERYRREVHTERNRRLAGQLRSYRAMEEHNAALKEQVTLLHKDYGKLQQELDNKRKKMKQLVDTHENELNFWRVKFDTEHKKVQLLQSKNEEYSLKLSKQIEENKEIRKDLDEAQSSLFDLNGEVKYLQDHASINERLTSDLNHLQKEISIIGEMYIRQKEIVEQFGIYPEHGGGNNSMNKSDDDPDKETLILLKTQLDNKSALCEANKCKINELEKALQDKDKIIFEQKRMIERMKLYDNQQLDDTTDEKNSICNFNQKLTQDVYALNHKDILVTFEQLHNERMKKFKTTELRHHKKSEQQGLQEISKFIKKT